MQTREPLLLSTQSYDSRFWSSCAALWTAKNPIPSWTTTIYLFRRVGERQSGLPGKTFLGSVVLHAITVFLLVRFPYTLYSAPERRITTASIEQNETIYYLPPLHQPELLPRVTPPGQGGMPGRGSQSDADPKPGSTLLRPDLTVISNAIHPDNARQTIIQPSSPPDLIIKQDLKLPNIVLGNPLPRPARPQFPLTPMKPNQLTQAVPDVAAPQVVAAAPTPPTALARTAQRPSLPIAPLAVPRANPGSVARAMAEPQPTSSATTLSVPFAATVSQPMLAVAPLTAPRANPNVPVSASVPIEEPQTQASAGTLPSSFRRIPGQPQIPSGALTPLRASSGSASGSTGGGSYKGEVANSGDSNGLLIVGVDPALAGASISLPPGNRYGAFSLSPAGGEVGSPGGGPSRTLGAGTGGTGAGGDESTGVGLGRGGGGGVAAGRGFLSISGPTPAAGGRAAIAELLASGTVFPVIATPRVRKNSLIISTGATGGGGLGIYHVLNCEKIYTMFVPMPTENWVLEYCQEVSNPVSTPTASTQSTQVVHLQEGLIPPDPVQKFDFRRSSVSADKVRGMLVINGIVREDGVVDNLQIFQGVSNDVDDIALAALKQWKFNPAKRGEKAIAVQILIGIQLGPAVSR